MSLKDLFFIFHKNDNERELREKIFSLERNIEELGKSLQALQELQTKEEKIKEPPIIIEKINIEKIVFDKYELNNNFGQLGIKELKGKLNIGATYGSEYTPMPDMESKEMEDPAEQEERKHHYSKEKGPKVNFKAKRENA